MTFPEVLWGVRKWKETELQALADFPWQPCCHMAVTSKKSRLLLQYELKAEIMINLPQIFIWFLLKSFCVSYEQLLCPLQFTCHVKQLLGQGRLPPENQKIEIWSSHHMKLKSCKRVLLDKVWRLVAYLQSLVMDA